MATTQTPWFALDIELHSSTQEGDIREIGVVMYDHKGVQGEECNAQISATNSLLKVMEQLKGVLGGCRIVAHNAPFEIRHFKAAKDRNPSLWIPEESQWVDLLLLVRQEYPHLDSHELGDLVSALGFRDEDFTRPLHTGLGDAQRAGAVLVKMVEDSSRFKSISHAFQIYDEEKENRETRNLLAALGQSKV